MEDKSPGVEGSGIFESLFGGFSNGLSIFNNNPFRRKSDASSAPEKLGLKDGDTSAKAIGKLSGEDSGGKRTNSNNSGKAGLKESGILDELPNVQQAEYRNSAGEEQAQGFPGVSTVQTNVKGAEGSGDDIDLNQAKDESESRKRKQSLTGDPDVDADTSLHEVASVESKKKARKKGEDCTSELGTRQSSRISKKRFSEDLSEGDSRKGRKLEKSTESKERSTDGGSQTTGKRPPFLTTEENKKNKRLKESASGNRSPGNDAEGNVGVETRSVAKRKTDLDTEEIVRRKRQDRVATEGSRDNGEESHGVVDSSDQPTGKRMPNLKEGKKDRGTGPKKEKQSENNSESGDRLSRTIFVGNLPMNVKTKQLTREFSRFGPVESARLRSVPLVDTKLPRRAAVITGQLNQARTSVNGYVVFKDEKSARAALAHNMHLFNEKHLRVDMASAPRNSVNTNDGGIEYDRARSVFVGNLPFDVEDEDVYALFDSKSPDLKVEAVRVVRDPKTSIGKGFAFVCFKKKAGASNALDNAEHIRLKSRPLRIIRFGFKSKQTRANEASARLSAKAGTSKSRVMPRPGAQQRLSKKGVYSYEGTRSTKGDGKPGKGASRGHSYQTAATQKKINPSNPSAGDNKPPAKKRPAVAARKLTSSAGKVDKRKREDRGTKLDNMGSKKRKFK